MRRGRGSAGRLVLGLVFGTGKEELESEFDRSGQRDFGAFRELESPKTEHKIVIGRKR
jgi:hypothetical protein